MIVFHDTLFLVGVSLFTSRRNALTFYMGYSI